VKPFRFNSPTIISRATRNRALFTVRHCGQARGADTLTHKKGFDRISAARAQGQIIFPGPAFIRITFDRSEEHTSELQSRSDLVCRLLLEKKKKTTLAKQQGNE